MKKIKVIFIYLLAIPFILWFSFSASISQEDKKSMDTVMSLIERQWRKEPIFTQISNYETFISVLSTARLKWDQKEMIDYLVSLFKNKVNSLKQNIMTQDQTLTNIDWNKVQDAWLSWHNETRSTLWLEPYKTNSALNYSALTWAQELANSNRKSNTHKRNANDWYYSYNSIKSRFENLWITFNYGWTAFSESNAYQYYNCKKSDCTNEMITALKKAYDFLEWEKASHYPAIVSKTYDQLWFWVAVQWNYVRVTTHYAINVN